jgi:hypothetical protein
MRSFNDQQRFVLAVGAAVERVAEVPAVTVLARLHRVVLVETYRKALDIRRPLGCSALDRFTPLTRPNVPRSCAVCCAKGEVGQARAFRPRRRRFVSQSPVSGVGGG